MEEPKDKQEPGATEKSIPEGDSLAMEAPIGKNGEREKEDKTLKEELGRLEILIVELKGNLIAVNRGIVARQDTIEQLTKRKQKLLEADKDPGIGEGLPSTIFRKTNAQVDLMDVYLTKDPIEIFPEEIWELILGNLTDPQDLRNCSLSFQLFDKILHPLKLNFLFVGVFPHICPYLDNDLILSCRRVCQDWNDGVDSFVDNHPALVPCNGVGWDPQNPPPTTNGLFHVEFSNRMGYRRNMEFLEIMSHHARNPIVGRALSIRMGRRRTLSILMGRHEVEEDDDDDESSDGEDNRGPNPFHPPHQAIPMPVENQEGLFWQALVNFLEKFGKHIWYLSLQCDREYSRVINDASVFRYLTETILMFAPNLRRIQIKGWLPRPMNLMAGPLPVILKLETLQFVRECGQFTKDLREGSVIRTLTYASCQQLKQLHIDWAAWKHIISKSNLEWDNLTELYISNGLGEMMKVEDLASVSMPQLRKIGLKCDFQELMKIIIELSPMTNLHVLRLFGDIYDHDILQAPDCLFAPPNLKTLEMDRVTWRGDYTFLLRFPFLENLVVLFDKGNTVRRQDVFDSQVELEWYMAQGRVYECEIWELMPRLKVFTVGRDVYTRECYDRIMSRKKNNMEKEVK